jgi:hypothetical protein
VQWNFRESPRSTLRNSRRAIAAGQSRVRDRQNATGRQIPEAARQAERPAAIDFWRFLIQFVMQLGNSHSRM